MKKLFQKILPIFISVCIVVSALPTLFFVNASDTDPKLTNKYDIIISEDGVNGEFGEKYNELSSKTKITLSQTIDLSLAEIFEFDVYIENYSELNKAIKNSPGNNIQTINLLFSSSTNSAFYATRNIASAEIFSQIKADGWNHIKLLKSNFNETNINWAKVKYVFLRFANNVNDTFNGLENTDVKIRNICSAVPTPDITEGNVVIYNDFLRNTLGESANDKFSDIKSRFTYSEIEDIDISDCNYIGIDFKVSDFGKLKALMDDVDKKVNLVLETSQGDITVNISNVRSFYRTDWYNTVVPCVIPENSVVTGVYFEITTTDSGEKLGEIYSIEFGIANIYGVNISLPEYNTTYGETISEIETISRGITVGEKFSDFSVSSKGEFLSLNNAQYIEFDLYVEDFEAFRNSFQNKNVDLQLALSNNENTNEKNIVWSSVEDNIIQNGWNHIILPISEAANNAFSENELVKSWSFKIVGADINEENSAQGQNICIGNIFATKYVKPTSNNKYDLVASLSENGKQFVMGDTFAQSEAKEENLANVNFSNAGYIEFDFYIQNYESWKATMAENSVKEICMLISSGGSDYATNSRTVAFTQKITHSGWNHITIAFADFVKGTSSGELDVSGVTTYSIYYDGNTSVSTNVLKGQHLAIANINGTKITIPDEYLGINTVKTEFNVPSANTTYKNDYSMNISGVSDTPINLNGSTFVEFDIYIEDYESFAKSFKLDANGKAVGVSLTFGIGMTKQYVHNNGYYQWENVEQYITHDGWNHVALPFGGVSYSKSDANGLKTKENIQCWQMWYGGDNFKNGEYKNIIGEHSVVVANFVGAAIVPPELPDNVLANVGTGKTATPGEKYHFMQDRYYQNKLEPVDFAGSVIEFDIYVSDYEKLKDIDAQSKRRDYLGLQLSSTPANLWGQYVKPENYFCAAVSITDKITHDGWNHIRVGKADFVAVQQKLDWSSITGWSLKYIGSTNVHEETNPHPNVTVGIYNIVCTGILSTVPADEDKAEKPDKNAVYISDAEMIADANGAWNGGKVNTDYKTEGKSSITMTFTYLSKPSEVQFTYLFDDTADMSDMKQLKFDFYVDLPQFISGDGNKAEFVLANSRRAEDDYYKWDISFSEMKSGWNSIVLDFSKAQKVGSPNIKEVKAIQLRFLELNVDKTYFPEIVVGIDNLRYLSQNGNTSLKINSLVDDDIETNDDFKESESDIETNDDFKESESDNDIYDSEASEVPSDNIVSEKHETVEVLAEPDVRYVKITKNVLLNNYKTFGIVLGVEAVILAAGTIIFVILYRKKRKI